MNLQVKMFEKVESWVTSGESKVVFLDGKGYSEAKFNYWLAKWKSTQQVDRYAGFRGAGFSEVKLDKVLEIDKFFVLVFTWII